MKFVAIFLFFSINSLLAAEKDPIVATVNGHNIEKSFLESEYQKNRLYVSNTKVTREKVLIDLINRYLGVQRAYKNGLEKTDIVKWKMEDILYHAQVSQDLAPRLKKIVVTDADIENYYKVWPEYRTAHILFRERVPADETEKNAAMNQAKEIYEVLKQDPDKFAEMANKYSQSAAAPSGGDMGYQPAVRLAPEYFEAIKNRSIGTITPPIKTQFGTHIIKILGVRQFKEINKNVYKKIVYDQKRDEIIEQYYKELRQSAKININKNLL